MAPVIITFLNRSQLLQRKWNLSLSSCDRLLKVDYRKSGNAPSVPKCMREKVLLRKERDYRRFCLLFSSEITSRTSAYFNAGWRTQQAVASVTVAGRLVIWRLLARYPRTKPHCDPGGLAHHGNLFAHRREDFSGKFSNASSSPRKRYWIRN